MFHPSAHIRLPGRLVDDRADAAVLYFSFCRTCSETPARCSERRDGTVGVMTVVVARWWLLRGVQLKRLPVVLEVLRLRALACVMGNAVDVERAKKELRVEELVWSPLKTKSLKSLHTCSFKLDVQFAEYTEETRLTMELTEQVAWFV